MGGSDEETLWRRTYGGVEKDKEINKECCSSQRRGKHNPFSNPLVWCGKSRKEHSWGSMRVDCRRPHSGPYNHGEHSSPERGMTAGAQREANTLASPSSYSPRQALPCPNPPGSWKQGTVYVGHPSRVQTAEWRQRMWEGKEITINPDP